METDASQSIAAYIVAWVPYLISIVISVLWWIWAIRVFKQYARNRERIDADKVSAIRELIETNRQIVAALRQLNERPKDRRS